MGFMLFDLVEKLEICVIVVVGLPLPIVIAEFNVADVLREIGLLLSPSLYAEDMIAQPDIRASTSP